MPLSMTHTIAVILIAGVFVTGCGSSDSNSGSEQSVTESDDSAADDETGDQAAALANFDGMWQTECSEFRVFGEPENAPPEGYVQVVLSLDSATSTYSRATRRYTDEQCVIEDTSVNTGVASGQIRAEGVVTTTTGLEATMVRYNSDDPSREILGLLYRDGDTLYRESRQSTVIEPGVVPTELALSSPLRLVN